jgi:hypothetical protein
MNLFLAALLAATAAASPAAGPKGAPEKAAKKEGAMQLAMVLLPARKLPAPAAVVAALREIAPPGEPAPSVDPGARAEGFGLSVGKGGSLLVQLAPAPVPGGEADQAFELSFSAGLDEDGKLAPHRAHLVAAFRDEPGRSRYDGLVRFTYLLAALAESSGAVGVYWGAAGATHEAGWFVAQARERDPDVMPPLWTGIEIVPDGPDRASVLSTGMQAQLGIRELRITTPRARLAENVGRMFDLLAYAARRGAAIPDGDTIGRDEREHLRVRHEPSPIDAAQRVWRIDFP